MPTNYYAGIGSRETPAGIQRIMEYIAKQMASVNWVLRSGGQPLGADGAFERGCKEVNGPMEIYLPWRGFEHNTSPLHPRDYPFSQEEKDFTARFHPAWNKCGPSTRLKHQRNTRILLGMEQLHGETVQPVKFVICWTENGAIKGGTGQALRIAMGLNIPIINLGAGPLEPNLRLIEKYILQYKVD